MNKKFIKYKDLKIRLVFYFFEIIYFSYYFFTKIFKKNNSLKKKSNLNILVIRRDMIGDFIISIPSLILLKKNFPNSRVFFVGTKGIRSFFSVIKDDFFERVFYIDPYFWVSKFFRKKAQYLQKNTNDQDDLKKLFKLKNNIDIGIDLRGDLFSLKLLYDLNCKKIISYNIGGGGYFLTSKVDYNYNTNEKEHDLDIIKYVIENFSINSFKKTSLDLKMILKEKVINLGKQKEKYICIQPAGGRWKFKRWPKEKYIELINKLLLQNKYISIKLINSDSFEELICRKILEKIDENNRVKIYNSENWETAIDLINNSVLFVGHDTSTAHICDLFNHKGIILFGPGDRKSFTPTSKNMNIIYKEYSCQPCEMRKCKFPNNPCINSIKVEEVYNLIKSKIHE